MKGLGPPLTDWGARPDWSHDGDAFCTAVERNPRSFLLPGMVEIWKLALAGSGSYERLTRFTNHEGYGASNPVVSDDGRTMAFQLFVEGGGYGNRRGLFLYDLTAAAQAR